MLISAIIGAIVGAVSVMVIAVLVTDKDKEKRQPNLYDSLVLLLRDFDINEEPYVYELADYICQLFKDGPYYKAKR